MIMRDVISNYNLESMQKELQKVMRIQDWDVITRLESDDTFYRRHDRDSVFGECVRDRNHRSALVLINEGVVEHDTPAGGSRDYPMDGWLHTLIHEYSHIFVDDYAYIAEASIEEDDPNHKYFESQLNLQLESLVNRITRTMLSIMDIPAFLDRHRKDEANGSTTEAKATE